MLREILRDAAHCSWPLPAPPWVMMQSWHDLLFAHWPVDAEKLQALIPGNGCKLTRSTAGRGFRRAVLNDECSLAWDARGAMALGISRTERKNVRCLRWEAACLVFQTG